MKFAPERSVETVGTVQTTGPRPGGRARIDVMLFIEPGCVACDRIMAVADELIHRGEVDDLRVFDRIRNAATCRHHGVLVFPSTYVNGRLGFHGEFTLPEFRRLYGVGEESSNLRGV